ncbi:hypothetical protein Avbf_06848 [Armadillidium vulgare]|nr:hypothetical protein Avbf_06848 [Armadillidium vulgare]
MYRKFIQKDPNKCLSALPVEEALKDDYELTTTSSSSSASSTFVEEEKLVNVEKILDLSGVTPVKKDMRYELVSAFVVAYYSKRIEILSLSPFSIEARARMFNTSHRLSISKEYSFPSKEDKCIVTKENIVKILKAPNLIG